MRQQNLDDVRLMLEAVCCECKCQRRLGSDIVIWTSFATFQHFPHFVNAVAGYGKKQRRSRCGDGVERFMNERSGGRRANIRRSRGDSLFTDGQNRLLDFVVVSVVFSVVFRDRMNGFREPT